MKRIVILNGAARKNGNTAELINSFSKGAKESGHEIREFYLQDMVIHGCMGCEGCNHAAKNASSPCVQKDDMTLIYEAFAQADVVVFASPLYFWTITGPLKTVADRLYAEIRSLGYQKFVKESVLLMTAGGGDYSQATTWYRTFERNLAWKSRGEILGTGKTKEAYLLGTKI
ncbi:MAG: flavodoxin family protein [Clostridium sp.]|nr:flavodoxin family protein [Clostridium sp.]